MSKYLLEDMVKAKNSRKNIREGLKTREINTTVNSPVKNIETYEDKKRPRYLLWFGALISMMFLFFAFSFLFSKADISVNPKTQDLVLNESLSASKDSTTDALSYDLVAINGTQDKTIAVNGTKDVKKSATGTVIIYNAFSSASQRLDIDTRLEGSNGKMYKTKTATVVPGMSKAGTPGKVEVNIYASVPGPDYNSTPLDFKIFGFKGTAKYAKIYGRSKSNISGGFIGKIPDLSDADKNSTIIDLKGNLQASLLQKATNQIPKGFILFKDAVFLNTDDANVSSVFNADNTATFTMKGILYGILLDEKKLTQKIAQDNVDKYDGSDIFIPGIKDLTFTLSNKNSVSLADVKNIDFNVSGNTKLVWRVDTDKFIGALLGKDKSDFNQVLLQYPNIDSATLTISPMWKMSIPDSSKDIKIIVNYPQ